MGLANDLPPRDVMGLKGLAKPSILLTGPGQYRDKSSPLAGDMPHLLSGTQLAIGDVEKVRPVAKLAKRLPGLDMGPIVGGVAIAATVMDRHRTIVADR